jgi:hypothetical protein
MMTPEDLIRILREMPEVKLRLIDLAWKVTGEDGTLDMEKVTFYANEISDAIREAKHYTDANKEVLAWLIQLVRSPY